MSRASKQRRHERRHPSFSWPVYVESYDVKSTCRLALRVGDLEKVYKSSFGGEVDIDRKKLAEILVEIIVGCKSKKEFNEIYRP